jgi:hypothetical protein
MKKMAGKLTTQCFWSTSNTMAPKKMGMQLTVLVTEICIAPVLQTLVQD